jgi:hypothetical protein
VHLPALSSSLVVAQTRLEGFPVSAGSTSSPSPHRVATWILFGRQKTAGSPFTALPLCPHHHLRQYVSPVDEPHAFNEEDESLPSASKRSPAPNKAAPSPKGPGSSIAYSLPDDRPLGPQHQVSSIPTCRQRTAQPTQWEARFLDAQPLFPPLGQQQQQQQPGGAASSTTGTAAAAVNAKAFKAAYQGAPGGAAGRALLGAAVQEMDTALGQQLVQVRGRGVTDYQLLGGF